MESPQDAQFLDLVYAAAVDHGLWPRVIGTFAGMMGCGSGFLSSFDIITGAGPAILSEENPEAIDRYARHFGAINPLGLVDDPLIYVRDWRLRILSDQDWMRREDYIETEYYNDFALAYDAPGCLMIRLGISGYQPHVLNINRPGRRGPFEACDFEIAARFHPHLIRAFDLSRKVSAERADDALGGEPFDRSPHAMFLVRADGHILRANGPGEDLLRRPAALKASGGRLTAGRPDVASRLHGLIAAAGSDEPSRAGGSMVIALPDRGLPLSVTIAPVRTPAHPLFQDGPCVLVCVSDPERRVVVCEQRLCEVLGLTPGEARVARALIDCGDLARASDSLGISVHTAKNHMARIHQKTGADRQVTLAALILNCAAP
jgi:DNA-binding CsgD family transcriptional regulator